jgi:hypothetical protein
MTDVEAKLELYAKLAQDPKYPLRDLIEPLGVSYPKLLEWRKEFLEAKENKTIHELVDMDKYTIAIATEAMERTMREIAPDETKEIAEAGNEFKKGVDGLQLLNTTVQSTALALTARLSTMVGNEDLTIREAVAISSALANMQTAFFNRNGINLQINQVNDSEQLSRFKSAYKA